VQLVGLSVVLGPCHIVPILPSAASSTFDAAAADCSIIGASIMIAAAVTLTTATLFF